MPDIIIIQYFKDGIVAKVDKGSASADLAKAIRAAIFARSETQDLALPGEVPLLPSALPAIMPPSS